MRVGAKSILKRACGTFAHFFFYQNCHNCYLLPELLLLKVGFLLFEPSYSSEKKRFIDEYMKIWVQIYFLSEVVRVAYKKF